MKDLINANRNILHSNTVTYKRMTFVIRYIHKQNYWYWKNEFSKEISQYPEKVNDLVKSNWRSPFKSI